MTNLLEKNIFRVFFTNLIMYIFTLFLILSCYYYLQNTQKIQAGIKMDLLNLVFLLAILYIFYKILCLVAYLLNIIKSPVHKKISKWGSYEEIKNQIHHEIKNEILVDQWPLKITNNYLISNGIFEFFICKIEDIFYIYKKTTKKRSTHGTSNNHFIVIHLFNEKNKELHFYSEEECDKIITFLNHQCTKAIKGYFEDVSNFINKNKSLFFLDKGPERERVLNELQDIVTSIPDDSVKCHFCGKWVKSNECVAVVLPSGKGLICPNCNSNSYRNYIILIFFVTAVAIALYVYYLYVRSVG